MGRDRDYGGVLRCAAAADYVPFVVYARRPDLRRIPIPNTGADLVDRMLVRDAFAEDPLGVPPYAVKRAALRDGLQRLSRVCRS